MSKPYIPFEPRKMYHIWTHANGKENLFRTDENYRFFLKKYDHHIHPFAETFAYCLMPNHLHLMVRIRGEKIVMESLRLKLKTSLNDFKQFGGFSNVISQQFSNLLNGYTKAYNKKYDSKGSLFMPNFKRKIIDSDEYYTGLIVYIHNNPIHHSFVTDVDDWPYSSWRAYQSSKPTKISKTESIKWFGNLENFVKVHRELNFEKLIPICE